MTSPQKGKLEHLLEARNQLVNKLSKLFEAIEEFQDDLVAMDKEIDRVILEDKRSTDH